MMKNALLLFAFVGFFMVWGQAIWAQFGSLDVQESDVPVVIELYTSQSCSSCPPADQVLESLAEKDNVIALACHVTYWNYLHWVDTQSHEFCTERQRAFAASRGSGRVYTPQMVVNGDDEFVGSRKSEASAAINRAIRQNKVKAVKISGDTREVSVKLPQTANGTYGVWVYGYQDSLTQDIPSGENRGRSVTYVNAAQHEVFAGDWDGTAKTLEIELPDSDVIDGIVVIAQQDKYGPVAAAGKLVF